MAVHTLHAHDRSSPPPPRGFALIELVLVVGIIGIIGAIAIPRITRAQSNAVAASLAGDIRVFQGAIETYAVEHNNLSPAHKPNGVISDEASAFMARLLEPTDDVGNAGGIFGPYLSHPIRNPINGLRTVRIDGPAAGANTHGWRFDSATREIVSDHATLAVVVGKPADGQAASSELLK